MMPTLQRQAAIYAVLTIVCTASTMGQEPAPWVTRFTGRHVFGNGVGHQDGFSSLEWFLPLNQDSPTEIYFGDFRGLVFDDAEFGGNAGMGYRTYNSSQDRIYGVNAYWDFRNEESLLFNQVGLGIESLGRIVDFRVNGYTPTVNDTSQRMPFTFVGNNLRNTEYHALTGLDYEVAGNLPDIGPVQSRVAVGGYYFDSSNTGSAAGWRSRLEIAFRDTVAVSIAAQEDDVFGETFNIAIELRQTVEHVSRLSRRSMHHKFRNAQGGGNGRSIAHRLADPVYRQQNIVLARTESNVKDAAGISDLEFFHVVPGGAGDGKFETPYGSLTAAMAPNRIVYTPQGGSFTEPLVSISPGARLLSNGPTQFVDSELGAIQIPLSGAGTDLVALPASIVGDVALADDSEFSGFEVTGGVSGATVTAVKVNDIAVNAAPVDAVTFTGSDAVTINRIALSMPTGRGILLSDTSAVVSDVTVTMAGDDGIEIVSAATDREVSLSDITITDAGVDGIDVDVTGAGNLTLNTADLTITDASNIGIDVDAGGAGDFIFTASGTGVSAVNNAMDVTKSASGDATISLSGTTLESTAGAGLNADGSVGAGTLFFSNFSNTLVNGSAMGGLLFNTVTFDANPMTVVPDEVVSESTTVGSEMNRVSDAGLSLTDVSGNWNAGALTIFNQGGTGLFADSSGVLIRPTLASTDGGVLDSQTGPALILNDIASALTFGTITSTDSAANALRVTSTEGSLASNTTTLSGSILPSIQYEAIVLPDVFAANLGTLTINSTIDNVEANNILKIGVTDGLAETYTPLTINGP